MRKDQITTFFLKYKNTFSAEESIQIQRLLENTKEEAFTVLMNYKPAFSWKIILYCIAVALLAASAIPFGLSYDWGFGYYFWHLDYYGYSDPRSLYEGFIMLLIGFIMVLAAVFTFKRAKRLKSKKEIILDEVQKILNAYQEM